MGCRRQVSAAYWCMEFGRHLRPAHWCMEFWRSLCAAHWCKEFWRYLRAAYWCREFWRSLCAAYWCTGFWRQACAAYWCMEFWRSLRAAYCCVGSLRRRASTVLTAGTSARRHALHGIESEIFAFATDTPTRRTRTTGHGTLPVQQRRQRRGRLAGRAVRWQGGGRDHLAGCASSDGCRIALAFGKGMDVGTATPQGKRAALTTRRRPGSAKLVQPRQPVRAVDRGPGLARRRDMRRPLGAGGDAARRRWVPRCHSGPGYLRLINSVAPPHHPTLPRWCTITAGHRAHEGTDAVKLQLSTDGLPARARFPLWAETMHSEFGLQAQPLSDAARPFQAGFSSRSGGPLLHFSVHADAHRITRPARGNARSPRDGYRIYREASAGAWFRLVTVEGTTQPGDLVIYQADLPFETQPRENYRHEITFVPKRLLEPHLPAAGRPLGMMLSGRSGVQALAGGYLDALVRNWDSMSAATMGAAADTLCRLIGIACGAAAAEQPDAVHAGWLTQARRHIDGHLADPDLSPASVAAALGSAPRTLHLAFEPSGSSFARHVLRRRLEACRTALLADRARPVTDIALGWGFGNLSTFYRAFQAAFGMTPGELRAAARDAHRQ